MLGFRLLKEVGTIVIILWSSTASIASTKANCHCYLYARLFYLSAEYTIFMQNNREFLDINIKKKVYYSISSMALQLVSSLTSYLYFSLTIARSFDFRSIKYFLKISVCAVFITHFSMKSVQNSIYIQGKISLSVSLNIDSTMPPNLSTKSAK
jgi:hypothetical protein